MKLKFKDALFHLFPDNELLEINSNERGIEHFKNCREFRESDYPLLDYEIQLISVHNDYLYIELVKAVEIMDDNRISDKTADEKTTGEL